MSAPQYLRLLGSPLNCVACAPQARVRFRLGGRLYDCSRPGDFLRLPIPLPHKLRFVALMLRAYHRKDWSGWEGRTARDLVESWGGAKVREAVFEPLCDLKFELPSD